MLNNAILTSRQVYGEEGHKKIKVFRVGKGTFGTVFLLPSSAPPASTTATTKSSDSIIMTSTHPSEKYNKDKL